MKKILAAVLALVMMMTAVAAFAEEQSDALASLKTGADVHQLIESIEAQDIYGTTFEMVNFGVAVQVAPVDGKIYRFITDGGEEAEQMFHEAYEAEYIGSALDAAEAYVFSLPITKVEEITAQPLSQEELDAWIGKPLGDLYNAGWTDSGSGTGETYVTMNVDYGFYTYVAEIDEPGDSYDFEKLEEYADRNIMSLQLMGLCGKCADPNYTADGEYAPIDEPGFNAPQESGLLVDLLGGSGEGGSIMSMIMGMLSSAVGENGELDKDALVKTLSGIFPGMEEELGGILDMLPALFQTQPQAGN